MSECHYSDLARDLYRERAERAEEMLVRIIDVHHRTTVGSGRHNPTHQDWSECPCLTCEGVRLLIPDRAAEELAKYRDERAGVRNGPLDDYPRQPQPKKLWRQTPVSQMTVDDCIAEVERGS